VFFGHDQAHVDEIVPASFPAAADGSWSGTLQVPSAAKPVTWQLHAQCSGPGPRGPMAFLFDYAPNYRFTVT
jgi:hypothetical protein